MKPLLHITSVPIAVEYKVTRAALKSPPMPAKVDVTRTRGQNQIATTQPQMQIDTTEAKASLGIKTAGRAAQEVADKGQAAAADATRGYAEDGNRIAESHGQGAPIADIAMSRIMKSHEAVLSYIPSTAPQYSVQPGSISFNYSMDRLTFDWNTHDKPAYEYVPGSIEFHVTQHPSLNIEYLGDPLYAPLSADPNYEPPPEILAGKGI